MVEKLCDLMYHGKTIICSRSKLSSVGDDSKPNSIVETLGSFNLDFFFTQFSSREKRGHLAIWKEVY